MRGFHLPGLREADKSAHKIALPTAGQSGSP